MTNTNYPKAIQGNNRSLATALVPALLASSISAFSTTAHADTDFASFNGGMPVFSDDIPEVLTTTRLRQPKTRVPGSTTVITGDMIRDLGIMNLYEVFRLVPGMTVNFVGSHQPVVTYHGTSHYEQRRMQVMVDGRTVHRVTLSDMDWEFMPVPLDMIERIEVARGPNSAAYGINAFLGTINIITRDPADTAGTQARVTRGSRGHLRTFASTGNTSENLDWRLSYEKRKFDGFDHMNDDGDPPFHDGHDINSFTYDSRLQFSNNANIEFRAGVVDGLKQEDKNKSGSLKPIENPDIDLRDYYLQTQLNYELSDNHFFHVLVAVENFKRQQRYQIGWGETAAQCLQANDKLYAEDAEGNDLCFIDGESIDFQASINDDYEDTRLELEIQDTLLLSDDLKLVTGAGFRKETMRSETYFNGRAENDQSRVFGNLEYTPWSWLTLNAGGNWERTTATDEGYFSPRVAANFTVNDRHALRFVYSRAVRTPDYFEQYPDRGYTLRNVSGEYQDLEGRRVTIYDAYRDEYLLTLGETLEEERITSYEISYFGQFPLDAAVFSLEVRGFKDQMRDMISGVIQTKEWSMANNVAVDQTGFEIEAMLEYPGTALRATYAYLDQDGWYTGEPLMIDDNTRDRKTENKFVALLARMSVRHSGSLAIIQDLPWNLKASSAFYWADEFNRRDEQFERIDARLSKQFFGPRYNAELAFTMQHYLNRETELSPDNIIADHNQFFVEASVKF